MMIVEHDGYTLQQAPNNHFMIIKDGDPPQMVLHSACTVKLSEEEAVKMIERYKGFVESGNFDRLYEDGDEDEE